MEGNFMWDVAVEIDPRTLPEWSLMGVIQPNKCEEPRSL